MARFYAEIQGNRGEATRMGTAESGMRSHIRGWHNGAAVGMRANGDVDYCDISLTSGSSGYASQHALSTQFIHNTNETWIKVPKWLCELVLANYDPEEGNENEICWDGIPYNPK
jgi:hypothetical protein